MDCGSKLAVGALYLVLSILCVAVVEAADTSIISGPHCRGKSEDKVYDARVGELIKILVNDTKNVDRKSDHEHYKYIHSYPYAYSGSVVGGATCDRDLIKWGCWRCLTAAEKTIESGCKRTDDGSIILGDCSLWFAKID